MSEQYRVSKYNLYLPLRTTDQYLLIQGVRGSFDVVTKDIVDKLQAMPAGVFFDAEKLDLASDLIAPLSKRGYITTLTEDEEYDFLKRLNQAINERARKFISVTMLPTYNCNFRCEYCFERNLQNKGAKWLQGKMTPEIVDAVYAQIEKWREEGKVVEGIYLFGGEPLLRANKDIVQYICEGARAHDLPISCVSNGYDLNHYIDLVKEFEFKYIQITIDGLADLHDKRRYLAGGQGTFDRILENVDAALKAGIKIVLRTNVNRKNVDAIRSLIELYTSKGWTEKENFQYYFKSTLKCYDALSDQYSDIELIEQLREEFNLPSTDVFQFNSIYRAIADKIEYMLKNNTFAPLRSGYCGANLGMYTVDPFGDIYPCWDVLTEEEERIGRVNLETQAFEFNDVHDRWKCRTVANIPDCRECPYMMFCGGGCAAQAKVMHNDINKVFCDDFQPLFEQVVVDVCEKYLRESAAEQAEEKETVSASV